MLKSTCNYLFMSLLLRAQATAEFRGEISVNIDEETEGKRMQRSGFAGIRTQVP